MSRAHLLLAALVVIGAIGIAFGLRDGDSHLNGATVQSVESEPLARADSLAADLLDGVRGLDPVACELATRAVRSQNWWGGSPFEPAASEDPQVTAIVRWALDGGGPDAVPVLAAALGDTDPCVRRVAAIRLGRIDEPSAAERLRRALESPDPAQREVAALGLGIAENPAAVPALIERLEGDESTRVRRAAAWALGEIE